MTILKATTPIYTAGYAPDYYGSKTGTIKPTSRSPQKLRELMEHLGRPESVGLIDIRRFPGSKSFPQWNRLSLQALFGSRYLWMQEWGNLNALNHQAIQIANFEAGLRRLEASLERRPGPRILLCACRSEDMCHRQIIARDLRELGYNVSPLDWNLPTDIKPEPLLVPNLFSEELSS